MLLIADGVNLKSWIIDENLFIISSLQKVSSDESMGRNSDDAGLSLLSTRSIISG